MTSRSKAYWAARAAELEAAVQNDATEAENKIIAIYKRAIKNIESDIDGIFNEFARFRELSAEDAGELISAAENKEEYEELLMLLEEATNPEEIKELEDKINAHAYGARIDRLNGVKDRIYIELRKAERAERAVVTALTNRVMQKAYYTTIYDTAKGLNCGIDFTLIPKRAIEKVQRADWFGSNYSSRIWNNNGEFISTLQKTIEDGITAGHSIDRMANKLNDFVNDTGGTSPRYVTERLVRTETAHFMAEGQAEAYKEIDCETYTFIAALSERTCDVCGSLDNNTFRLSERVTGKNYPPIHPNCRCSTITGDFKPRERGARDPLTGKNYKVDGSMTFEEWKNSLTEEQRDAMGQHIKQMRNRSADKKQYEQYKSVIGAENMPKTFDKFVNLKYNNSDRWGLLKDYKQSRSTNMISSFTPFKDYVKYKKRIDDELIGLVTSDGVEITGQSKHFIERVFGTSEDPHTGRPRDGVELKDIKKTLLKGTCKHRTDSLRYFGEKCVVSVNKDSHILIQTTPRSR